MLQNYTAIAHAAPNLYVAGGPRPHNTHPRPIRAASAGPWVPGHVVRPARGSVRYSLGARPTSRACLVRQNQQRHGRPPHGAHLAPPRPATTPGRSMPVLIGHTARPVRRIFPSWQLLPAQLVVSYLRVNTRDKTKSGSCCAVVSCNCVPCGFVFRRRGRRRRSCGPKRRHLLPLLFLGCLGCLGCPLASSATTPLAFRRRLDVVSTGFSAARSIWTSRSRNYRHGSPGEARRRSARGVALRDAHDRPLAREGGQGIWLQARGAVWPLGGR